MAGHGSTNAEQGDDRHRSWLAIPILGTVTVGVVLAFLSGVAWWKVVLLFAAAALVALAWIAWLRRRRKSGRDTSLSRGMLGFLESQRAGRDPIAVAQIAKLKRKFEAILPKLLSSSTGIYGMPWYIIIGPSGSGKSWLLRAINMNSLQSGGDRDEKPPEGGQTAGSSGQGGTLLMDWWVGEKAIVLDTAGSMVFPEEARALDSPEWAKLLELLSKERPEIPFNGLIVAIPASMLLLEPGQMPAGSLTLDGYADLLKKQIQGHLQQELKLRFPVYFIITKSDIIPGFREFTDELELQSAGRNSKAVKEQIFGWSNPIRVASGGDNQPVWRQWVRGLQGGTNEGPSDQTEGFSPREVVSYLRGLTSDVRKHRLKVLAKWAGKTAGFGEKSDERSQATAAMIKAAKIFAFAPVLDRMTPRLQAFLERVFSPHPLAPLPPYVRGIYFASSMREGEVLDKDEAQRLGIPLAELIQRPGESRNPEKAFFVSDLFSQKIFVEQGLVTPLVSAREYLFSKRRELQIGVAIFVGLLAMIAAGGWFYLSHLEGEVRGWDDLRQMATRAGSVPWYPVVVADESGRVMLNTANLDFHDKMSGRGLRRKGFGRIGALFSVPLDPGKSRLRRGAQQRLFEKGVVLPLADLALQRLTNGSPLASGSSQSLGNEAERMEAGLAGLLEFELPASAEALSEADLERVRRNFVEGILGMIVDDLNGPDATRIAHLFEWVYGDAGGTKEPGAWPPVSIRGGNRLQALALAGLPSLEGIHERQLKGFSGERRAFEALVGTLKELENAERKLLGGMYRKDSSDDSLRREVERMSESWEGIQSTNRSRLPAGSPAPIQEAWTNFLATVTREAKRRSNSLRDRILSVPSARSEGTNTVLPMLEQLRERLSARVNREAEQIATIGQDWAATLDRMDSGMLSERREGRESGPSRPMGRRLEFYRDRVLVPIEVPSELGSGTNSLEHLMALARALIPELALPARVDDAWDSRLREFEVGGARVTRWGVITNFVTARAVEAVIQKFEMPAKLSEADVDLSGVAPRRCVERTIESTQKIEEQKRAWGILNRAAGEVRARKPAADRPGDAVRILEDSNEIIASSLVNKAKDDRLSGQEYPVGDPTDGARALTRAQVLDQWKGMDEWSKELVVKGELLKKWLGDDPLEELKKEIAGWKSDLSLLVDSRGRERIYRLAFSTPQDRKGALEGGNKLRDAERDVASVRWVELNEVGLIGDPSAAETDRLVSARFPASRRLTLSASTTRRGGAELEALNWPKRTSWTVIDLIRRAEVHEDESGEESWLVPIRLSDPVSRQSAGPTIYLVVTSVEAAQRN